MRPVQSQDGFVAGGDVLALGILVFMVATLIAVNAWAVVDAKLALADASREGVRTYVEEVPDPSAEASARRAALDSYRGHGRLGDSLEVRRVNSETGDARCAPVTFEATAEVSLIIVPLLPGGRTQVRVRAQHTELVDPLRTGVGGEASCV